MVISVAYLGPPGTNAEMAALTWSSHGLSGKAVELCPYPSISQALRATANGTTDFTVAPVENSIEGSVTTTLDGLWQWSTLQIQQAVELPISHAFLSRATSLAAVRTVYSHPQALAQCQHWLEAHISGVQLIPTNSTVEALQQLEADATIGAIASQRAAQLYNLPVLAHPINDYPDNCTRFWVLGLQRGHGGRHTSLAFSVPANVPGALVKPLHIFANRGINLSRIESRPTKKSLGDYLFFVDIEANIATEQTQKALASLQDCTETLKIFGSYDIIPRA
ncbi:MAG: prephenate dehydratase [Kaiparowitsia implicata GSE-PSE-MK54-09C]|jgi:prephenate dehydratase|nr:prephenate dehydratase [Kaiparowitsia implicata GSE-PSE-MK54-09C]